MTPMQPWRSDGAKEREGKVERIQQHQQTNGRKRVLPQQPLVTNNCGAGTTYIWETRERERENNVETKNATHQK